MKSSSLSSEFYVVEQLPLEHHSSGETKQDEGASKPHPAFHYASLHALKSRVGFGFAVRAALDWSFIFYLAELILSS